ncbi:MAG: hypothetical protein Q4C56_02555 [Peptococcaceae bacterium]|nr:hypothetical protein [Peptococcaceae bacterium]
MDVQNNERTFSLQKRSERCVCKYCGGHLRVKSVVFNEIVDGRTELYCESCGRIEFGVEPEIYRCAKYYVDELDYNCYQDMDYSETTRQMSIARVSEIMEWVAINISIIGADGFTVPIKLDLNKTSECLHLTDDDL